MQQNTSVFHVSLTHLRELSGIPSFSLFLQTICISSPYNTQPLAPWDLWANSVKTELETSTDDDILSPLFLPVPISTYSLTHLRTNTSAPMAIILLRENSKVWFHVSLTHPGHFTSCLHYSKLLYLVVICWCVITFLLKSSVMWLKLYWCGLVFVFFHTICIVFIYWGWKQWTTTSSFRFFFKRPTQTAHPQTLQRPRHDHRARRQAWKTCSSYGTLMLTLKTPLDQLSMCVRAQTNPSHL